MYGFNQRLLHDGPDGIVRPVQEHDVLSVSRISADVRVGRVHVHALPTRYICLAEIRHAEILGRRDRRENIGNMDY